MEIENCIYLFIHLFLSSFFAKNGEDVNPRQLCQECRHGPHDAAKVEQSHFHQENRRHVAAYVSNSLQEHGLVNGTTMWHRCADGPSGSSG